MIQFSELDTTKSCEGLVPAIIQDDNTMQVLMLGYMNAEAYEKTVATGKVTFTAGLVSVFGPKVKPAATS